VPDSAICRFTFRYHQTTMQQPSLFSSRPDSHRVANGPVRTPENGETQSQANVNTIAAPPVTRDRFTSALLTTEFLLAVMVRIFIGVFVLVLPWSPLWDGNHLLQGHPAITAFLSYGAVRGIFSGLGLLNLWIAVDDTLHRDERHL
jgi:hypothetical protein